MICKKCGTEALDTDKFCNNCGCRLKEDFNNYQQNIDEFKKADNFNSLIMPVNYSNIEKYKNIRNTNYDNNYISNYKPLKNNNKLAKLFIILGSFCCCLSLIILFFNSSLLFNNYSGKRTIMIYMIGSDLESKYYSASADIVEMVNSNADFENINLLIYTGGTKDWHYEGISSDENAIYKVTSDGLEKIKSYSRKDIGNASTLTEFIDYSYDNYKAEKYSLILWDHGGGPIYGYGYDEYNTTNSLTLLELKKALKNSQFGANNKLEFIGFDACLMATAEIAYVVSDYADYMIASQEVEPGDGWNYAFLKNIKKSSTTYDIGKDIVDSYFKYYNNKLSGKGISLSLIKLNKIDLLEQKLDLLFENIDKDLVINFSEISRSRSNSKTFGKVSATSYDLVDLYDLVDQLPEKYYEKVISLKSAIEDLVVYQKTDLLDTNGISIYFPYDNKKQLEEIMYLYKYFDFAEEYTDFIDNFASELIGERLYNWRLEGNIPITNNEGIISVTVPQEVIENYSKASYIIFEKTDTGYYIPRFKGTDVEVNGNTLTTTLSKKGLVASSSDGNEIYISALESEKGTNYIKYIIPGTLQRWDGDFLNDFEMLPVYLQVVVDEENPNGKIAGAIEAISDEENSVSPKVSIDINDWKIIQLLNYEYKIFDDTGNYSTDWSSSGIITGFEAEIDKGFSIEFKDLDISKNYYALFRIADSQGNVYTTNIVKVFSK